MSTQSDSNQTLTAPEIDVLAAAPFAISRSGTPFNLAAGRLQVAAIMSATAKGWLAEIRTAGGRAFVLTPAGAAIAMAMVMSASRNERLAVRR